MVVEYNVVIEHIGSVSANSSIVVPVRTTLKPSRSKRNVADPINYAIDLIFDYVCQLTLIRTLEVILTRDHPGKPPLPCGLGYDVAAGYYGACGPPVVIPWDNSGVVRYDGGDHTRPGSAYSMTYNPVTPMFCDCVKNIVSSCVMAFNKYIGCELAFSSLTTAVNRGHGSVPKTIWNLALGILDTGMACVVGFIPSPIAQAVSTVWTMLRCLMDVAIHCLEFRWRRDVTSEVANNVVHTAAPVNNFLAIMTGILGDDDIYNLDRSWYPAFKNALTDGSEAGSLLSRTEKTTVLAGLTETEVGTLDKFLSRWNNTEAAWQNGTLNDITDTRRVINLRSLAPKVQQYLDDIEAAEQAGFGSIFDAFDHAIGMYRQAQKNQGKDNDVCAKVRIRITQELVLVRDAFNARLEIENGEQSELRNIKVEMEIWPTSGNGELSNDVFSIGSPTLVGITAVDGTGVLGTRVSGSAEWIMIPYSNAALVDMVQYDVGGRLSYSVGTANFSVPLLPDTIAVKPNPSLSVDYFHEKHVQGDNPLTVNVKEPIVPFTLAVMVRNAGYGTARAMKISSAQPEIIENEKGLLISFKIIGAQLGNRPMSPSLMVDFGDIDSFQTKSARWLLTSSFMGTFYNFSATFQNINPLGDPQLSLLDHLGYHELIHLVRIDVGNNTDDLDDFLVNDVVDNDGMPDRLYNSENGSDVADVFIGNVTSFTVTEFTRPYRKVYTNIHLVAEANVTSWFYLRMDNYLPSPFPRGHMHLLAANRVDDGKEMIVDKNVWLTTNIQDTHYLHLLDFPQSNNSDNLPINYTVTFGPRNMYAPVFNKTTYTVAISWQTPVHTPVLTLSAYDMDKNSIMFTLTPTVDVPFSVDNDGTVRVTRWPLTDALMTEFDIMATDDGIPARTATVRVSVAITREPYSTNSTVTESESTTTTTGERSSTKQSLFTANIQPTSTVHSSTKDSVSPDSATQPTSTVKWTPPTKGAGDQDGNTNDNWGKAITWIILTAVTTSLLVLFLVWFIRLRHQSTPRQSQCGGHDY